MTFFLDFDRTIFDTDRSYKQLSQKLVHTPLKNHFDEVMLGDRSFDYDNPERNEIARAIEALVEKGEVVFAPGELAKCVFEDAHRFLEKHGQQVVVVTANRSCPLFQNAKVETSGVRDLVAAVHVIPLGAGNGKSEEIMQIKADYPGPYLFIDDHDTQLAAVSKTSSEIDLFEMRRDGKAGSGYGTVIHNFDELEQLL